MYVFGFWYGHLLGEMNAVLCVCLLQGQVFHEKVLLNDFNMENMHGV